MVRGIQSRRLRQMQGWEISAVSAGMRL